MKRHDKDKTDPRLTTIGARLRPDPNHHEHFPYSSSGHLLPRPFQSQNCWIIFFSKKMIRKNSWVTNESLDLSLWIKVFRLKLDITRHPDHRGLEFDCFWALGSTKWSKFEGWTFVYIIICHQKEGRKWIQLNGSKSSPSLSKLIWICSSFNINN